MTLQALVDAKLDQIGPRTAIDRLRARILTADDARLFRINPYTFAAEEGLGPEAAIEALLRATAVGLLRADWCLVCRGCGEYALASAGLADLRDAFHCIACARDRETNLDEQVEVGFTLHPDIRPLRYERPETLALEDYFWVYKFSRNILVRGEGRSLVEHLQRGTQLMAHLAPGETRVIEADLPAGWIVGSPRAMITLEGERVSEPRTLELAYDGRQFLPRPTVAPGPLRLVVTNATAERLAALLYFTPIVTYFDYVPFMTGQRLLNTEDFRRYLKTEVVRPGSGIPTRDNTLLFTDLRGSTALYDRIGDTAAFELVSRHIEALAQVVTRHAGVVVKTIGDAVMASFTRPIDAVRAALDMQRAIEGLGSEPLYLKIGIHRGPCLVVNVRDQVDYFGQTVNIAARVQATASGGQLCITDAVRQDESVRARLAHFGEVEPEDVMLRGVDSPRRIFRYQIDRS